MLPEGTPRSHFRESLKVVPMPAALPLRAAERGIDPAYDISHDRSTLYRDGIVGLKGAFSRDWAEAMREDMMTAFWEAIQRPGGAVGRGPRRWYVEIHPQAFRGFADLVTHPWVTGMCEAVLGPDYQIVEIGFDTPFQGAKRQPWHRDFPSPRDTYEDRRVTSLAFSFQATSGTGPFSPFRTGPLCFRLNRSGAILQRVSVQARCGASREGDSCRLGL